ncbi:relaxase/mobilization nuclease domain-containing protein [Limosilactobacillus albertensis]|uniref:Relaxase/mobilization nuclease domain-containing protein n=1 Tax=Limosilactobacillus albertensis TaxID=2759752 RepID=A0A839H6V2_9LACO|nr:relaxase/mobilization nuclease domain-containing protein [Limosilactobacillus albertensis]MBB1124560.1 relaxase/mobilization nuclease domain-containing protein [Limosilactobacillus albertensis]MCD7123186.1 relaxase/mobilization nuclease domain-containing protein [Limosilactobacillus albertensis]
MYVKSNYITNMYGRLKYLFDEPAHDGSAHRVLGVNGSHVYLWGSRGQPYPAQSGYFINQQFKMVRRRAMNKRKRQQAQHLICSFSDREMPTGNSDNINVEVGQINQLVGGFMKQYFPQTQWVSAIQADGQEGHKLHCHILINSVRPDGKCVRTNEFSVGRLRHEWNNYLKEHYLEVTGHVYVNPFDKARPGKVVKPQGWQAVLKGTLQWARDQAQSIKEYLGLLKTKNVTVTKRNKKGDWSYHTTVNGKKKTVRDFYQRRDRKTGLVKATRGMGQEFTPFELNKYFKQKQQGKNKEVSVDEEKSQQCDGRSKRLAESRRQQQRFNAYIAKQQLEADDEESSYQTGSSKLDRRRHQVPRQSADDLEPGS